MKVILDSNVIVAAFASRGLCSSLFEAALERTTIYISNQLLNEVSRVLSKKMKMPADNVAMILNYLKEYCILPEADKIILPRKQVCRDRDDDHVLALAEACRARYIVTGDNDLLVLKKYGKTGIVSVRDFWEKLRKLK